jgi:hypothetical protein
MWSTCWWWPASRRFACALWSADNAKPLEGVGDRERWVGELGPLACMRAASTSGSTGPGSSSTYCLGDIATGLAAVGGVAIGLVSVGGVAVGLVALGGVAIGLVAVGAVAIGVFAAGAVAIGLTGMGAVTAGLVMGSRPPGRLAPSGKLGAEDGRPAVSDGRPGMLRGRGPVTGWVRVRRRVAATSRICSGPSGRVGRGSRRGRSLWEHAGHRVGAEDLVGGGPDQRRIGHPIQRG